MKKVFSKLKTWFKNNYMQLIFLAVILTMFFIFSSYTFVRLRFSFKACWSALVYYFQSIFSDEVTAPETPLDMIIEYHGGSILDLIPIDFRNFFNNFSTFWHLLINKSFFSSFLSELGDTFRNITLILTMLSYVIVIVIVIRIFKNKYHPGEEPEDTKSLTRYKKLEAKVFACVSKIKGYLRQFFKPWLIISLIILFLLWMNVGAIIIDSFGNYFYFLAEWKFLIIGESFTTFIIDFLPQYFKIPLIIRLIAIYYIYDLLRLYFADKRMQKILDADIDFLEKQSGNVILISGASRVGKNSLATCLSVIYAQIVLPKQLLGIMLDIERKFPFVNYNKVANFMDEKIVLKEINTQNDIYSMFFKNDFTEFFEERSKKVWDELTVEKVEEALCDWALVYYFYTMKSPLSVSNYAISFNCKQNPKPHYFNVDHLNMLKEKEKDYCNRIFNKVINFDFMRMGRKFSTYGEDYYVPDIGVYNITEAGKERGDTESVKNSSKTSEIVNKRNDKFTERIKIWSHAATIRFVTLFKLILDEQNDMDINIAVRRLAETILTLDRRRIKDKIALKGWNVEMIVCKTILQAYDKYNLKRKENYQENTTGNYIIKEIISKINLYFLRRVNLYSYSEIKLFSKNGSTEGVNDDIDEKVLYKINKLSYGRYEPISLKRLFLRKMATSKTHFDSQRDFTHMTPTDADYKYMRSFLYTEFFNITED